MAEREELLAALKKWDYGATVAETAEAVREILGLPEFERSSLAETLAEMDEGEMDAEEIAEDLLNLYDIDDGPAGDDDDVPPDDYEEEDQDGD